MHGSYRIRARTSTAATAAVRRRRGARPAGSPLPPSAGRGRRARRGGRARGPPRAARAGAGRCRQARRRAPGRGRSSSAGGPAPPAPRRAPARGGRRARRERACARAPTASDAAGGIDDRRLPLRVGDHPHRRPHERAGHEQQPALLEVERLLRALVDAQHAVGEAHGGVDVGEQPLGAAVGHLARAVEDVALQHARTRGQWAASARSSRRAAGPPGRPDRPRTAPARTAASGPGRRAGSRRATGGRVAATAAISSSNSASGLDGRGLEEVRGVGVAGLQRAQDARGRPRGPPARLDRPRQMQRLPAASSRSATLRSSSFRGEIPKRTWPAPASRTASGII